MCLRTVASAAPEQHDPPVQFTVRGQRDRQFVPDPGPGEVRADRGPGQPGTGAEAAQPGHAGIVTGAVRVRARQRVPEPRPEQIQQLRLVPVMTERRVHLLDHRAPAAHVHHLEGRAVTADQPDQALQHRVRQELPRPRCAAGSTASSTRRSPAAGNPPREDPRAIAGTSLRPRPDPVTALPATLDTAARTRNTYIRVRPASRTPPCPAARETRPPTRRSACTWAAENPAAVLPRLTSLGLPFISGTDLIEGIQPFRLGSRASRAQPPRAGQYPGQCFRGLEGCAVPRS
jgi:hypothetical protein